MYYTHLFQGRIKSSVAGLVYIELSVGFLFRILHGNSLCLSVALLFLNWLNV